MAGQPKRLQERPAHPATCASPLRLDTPPGSAQSLQQAPCSSPPFRGAPTLAGSTSIWPTSPAIHARSDGQLGIAPGRFLLKAHFLCLLADSPLFNNLPSSPHGSQNRPQGRERRKKEAATSDSGVASLISKELTACRALPRGVDLRPRLPELWEFLESLTWLSPGHRADNLSNRFFSQGCTLEAVPLRVVWRNIPRGGEGGRSLSLPQSSSQVNQRSRSLDDLQGVWCYPKGNWNYVAMLYW